MSHDCPCAAMPRVPCPACRVHCSVFPCLVPCAPRTVLCSALAPVANSTSLGACRPQARWTAVASYRYHRQMALTTPAGVPRMWLRSSPSATRLLCAPVASVCVSLRKFGDSAAARASQTGAVGLRPNKVTAPACLIYICDELWFGCGSVCVRKR